MSHIGILSFVIFMFLLSQTIKIMNKLYYIFFSLLLTLFACDNGVIMSSDSDITTRSSVNSFSLFKDIKTYTLSNFPDKYIVQKRLNILLFLHLTGQTDAVMKQV